MNSKGYRIVSNNAIDRCSNEVKRVMSGSECSQPVTIYHAFTIRIFEMSYLHDLRDTAVRMPIYKYELQKTLKIVKSQQKNAARYHSEIVLYIGLLIPIIIGDSDGKRRNCRDAVG